MPAQFIGQVFTFKQPDGSTIQVRGWGDQHYAVFETLDGYTVTQNPGDRLLGGRPAVRRRSRARAGAGPGAARWTPVAPACRAACASAARRRSRAAASPRCAWAAAGASSVGEERKQQMRALRADRRRRWSAAGAAAAPDGGRLRRPVPADRLLRRPGHDPARGGRALLQPAGLHRLRQQRLGARLLPRELDRPLPLHEHRGAVLPGAAPQVLLHRRGDPAAAPRAAS